MFNIFDPEAHGFMGLASCEGLVTAVFAARKDHSAERLLLVSLKRTAVPGVLPSELRVYRDDFVGWTKKHPQAMVPLTCAQLTLRNKVQGIEWWASVGVDSRDRVMRK